MGGWLWWCMAGCLAGAAGAGLDLEKKPPLDGLADDDEFELPPKGKIGE